jgi:hypothetical protein
MSERVKFQPGKTKIAPIIFSEGKSKSTLTPETVIVLFEIIDEMSWPLSSRGIIIKKILKNRIAEFINLTISILFM